MSKSNDGGTGCLIFIALVCLATGFGSLCGMEYGFILFGAVILAAAVLS